MVSWFSCMKRHQCRVHPEQPPKQSEFMKDIHAFVASKNDPNSVLGIAYRSSPQTAEALDKQLETFAHDMQRLENGEISYADMRGMYG